VRDLTEIPQPWLRQLFRDWVTSERPSTHRLGLVLRACVLAGQALAYRPDGGVEPSELRFSDMSAVADQFRTALRHDGVAYGAKHRNQLFGWFCDLLDFGRRAEVLPDISGRFVRDTRAHRIAVEEPNEDEIGKAVPEPVIRQLDDQLHLLGANTPYGDMAAEDIALMMRTAYIVLRDTGRRPGEIACLRTDCVENIDGEVSLVWNNNKSKRHRRRLPITEDVAAAIQVWQHRRAQLTKPAQSKGSM